MPKNKQLIILGTARSGTSWISELIARQHRYRLLFEPEHEFNTKKGKLLCDTWLEYSNNEEAALNYIQKLYNNRVDCNWIAQNSNRKYKRHLWPFIPKKIIIKFVRGNLLGMYLNQKFETPTIHLLRNPYDVINSQKRSSFPWLQELDIFRSQKELVDLISKHFNINLYKLDDLSIIEKKTVRWCIENVLPLEIFNYESPNYFIVKYEDLYNGINKFTELCSLVGIKPISNIDEVYKKPSSKTHKNSKIKNKENNINTFSLTEEEISEISGILKTFNTKLYPILN